MYQENEQVVGYIIRNQFLNYRKQLNSYIGSFNTSITMSWLDFLKDYVKPHKQYILKLELGYYFIGLRYLESTDDESELNVLSQKEQLDTFLNAAWLDYVTSTLESHSLVYSEILALNVSEDSNFLYKRYVLVENHVADESDFADDQFCNPKKKSLFTVEDMKEFFNKNEQQPVEDDPIFKDSIFRGATNTVNEGLALVNSNEKLLGKSVAIQFRYLGSKLKKEFEQMDINGSFNRTSAMLKSRVFLSDVKDAINKESTKKPDIL